MLQIEYLLQAIAVSVKQDCFVGHHGKGKAIFIRSLVWNFPFCRVILVKSENVLHSLSERNSFRIDPLSFRKKGAFVFLNLKRKLIPFGELSRKVEDCLWIKTPPFYNQ